MRDWPVISIHAPREGSDSCQLRSPDHPIDFNPRSPRGERQDYFFHPSLHPYFNPRSPRGERRYICTHHHPNRIFQSTLPARGATSGSAAPGKHQPDFNPRSPRGERPINSTFLCILFCDFNPRSPRGERPADQQLQENINQISIHAPREGSDDLLATGDFTSIAFQSTLPARGATNADTLDIILFDISIHAPREGSDLLYSCWIKKFHVFQSTLPARGATLHRLPRSLGLQFQSTLPARGATGVMLRKLKGDLKFQSTLPARGATPVQ